MKIAIKKVQSQTCLGFAEREQFAGVNRKNIRLFCFTALTMLLLMETSCSSYLDVDQYFDDQLTLDSAFTKRAYAEGFLSNAFEVMYDEVSDISTGGTGGYALFASDELLRMDDSEYTKKYQNGEYSATSTLTEDKWKRVYEPVRKASTFINRIDDCREMTFSERADAKAQARFLRAYAYWVLLRQYGPLPLIPEEGFDISMTYDELSIQRNTFDECVDYIANDFLLAAQNLPLTRTANNINRPTRGAALAARARLLLYAASPLYNGNTELFNLRNYEGAQLISQTYDESKWGRAAAAALEVIRLNQYELYTVQASETTVTPPYHAEYSNADYPDGWANIDPFESYRQIFNGAVAPSRFSEIIFTRANDGVNGYADMNNLQIPFSLNGRNAIAVTQKQVKAYYMSDGKSIDEAASTGEYKENGFTTTVGEYQFLPSNVSLQYANREPRFYASIAYSGSIWECESANETQFRNKQVFYYKDLTDGKLYNNAANFPITGIGMKKYYNPEDARTSGGYLVTKFEPAIRYADVLLWYAEALNELTSGQSYTFTTHTGDEITVKREITEMRFGMKRVRMRAGLPDLADNIYDAPDAFRRALKKERQIEFFAESKRYFDLRRWKDAMVEENIPITGCNVEMTNSDSQRQQFYQETVISSFPKIFLEKMYLWPIPQYELTRNKRLTQNPGW